MYVSSIFLDRFGRRANLRVASLANGLNVIYGPQGSGKTTLVDFLRAMWTGFDSGLREQYLPPKSRGFGGAISVQTAHGRQTISRYDDGGPEGRLTVEREDGAVIGRRHLHDLIGDVSVTLLERSFLIDFQRRPRLEELLTAATARGYELGNRPASSTPFQAVDKRLQTLDVQLARWQRTLRDVVARKQRAAERSDKRPAGAAAVNAAPRQRLLALKTRIQELQQSVAQFSTPERECVCQALRTTLADSLPALRDDVDQLCDDLNHWQSHHHHREAVGERDQLARCERELRQAIQSLIERRPALLQRMVAANSVTSRHPDPSSAINLVREASQYLRRLSSDEWSGIDVTSPQEVWVEGAQGRRLRYDDLDSGTGDQVYLAFCLAVVAACDRDGIHIPLVLNAAFTHYRSKQVGDALELLRDIGRGRQVLCLTRHEQVVSLARMLNVPVHSLSSPEAAVARPFEAVELSKLRPLSTQTENRPPLGARHEVRADPWDAEEFPGELTDRVRHPNASSSKPVVMPGSSRAAPSVSAVAQTVPAVAAEQTLAEYYLSENDPIERVPFINEIYANRLREIGIRRVGDLLRTPAAQCAADLQSRGITREMVQSWQSQVRLMCRIRRLGPYDARILVACGITDPEQLSGMSSAALRARVRQFSTSAEGQPILLSGTESELSRVMEWVQVARDERQRKSTRTEGANHSVHSERGESTKQVKRRKITRESSLEISACDEQAAMRDSGRVDRMSGPASLPVGKKGLRFLLQRSAGVVEAPSIGPSMAKRLEELGIVSVADLLNANPETIATRLQMNRVKAATVRRWQQQTELVCRVPQLSGQNARILVSVGVSNVDELAAMDPNRLWQRVQPFCVTPEGKRMLRNGSEPSAAEVAGWVHGARHARALNAA